MAVKRGRTERINEARRRLREQSIGPPGQMTRPPGNSAIDQRDLQRGLERLGALVGR